MYYAIVYFTFKEASEPDFCAIIKPLALAFSAALNHLKGLHLLFEILINAWNDVEKLYFLTRHCA